MVQSHTEIHDRQLPSILVCDPCLLPGNRRNTSHIIKVRSLSITFLYKKIDFQTILFIMNDFLAFPAVYTHTASCHPAEDLGIYKLILILRRFRNVVLLFIGYKYRTGSIFDSVTVNGRTVILFPIQDPAYITPGVFLI